MHSFAGTKLDILSETPFRPLHTGANYYILILIFLLGGEPMLCVRNGLLMLPGGIREADLYIRGDKIFSVGGRWAGAEVIDAAGCWVFPGFVSICGGPEQSGGAAERSERALAMGCTTAVAGVPAEEAERAERQRRGRSSCDWVLQGLLDPDEPPPLSPGGALRSFALTAPGEGGGWEARLEELLRAAEGRPVRVPVSGGREFFSSRSEGGGEKRRVQAAIHATERAGGALWLGGIRGAESLEEIRAARRRGVRVLAEAEFDALWPSEPDGRAGEDAAVLREALLRGEIQLLEDLGGENIPRLITELSREGERGLLAALRVLCGDPAAAVGLCPGKGMLKVGYDADVTVWDPAARRAKSVLLRGILAAGRGTVLRYGQGKAWSGGEAPEGAE